MLHDLVFSAHVSTVGNPRLATPDQMLALEDSPAYFRTRRHDKALNPLPPVKLQKYDITYGVIDAQLKDAAQSKGAPPVLEFAAAAYDNDGKLLNSMLNQGRTSLQNPKGRRTIQRRPSESPVRLRLPRHSGTRRSSRRRMDPPRRPRSAQQPHRHPRGPPPPQARNHHRLRLSR
jgi:hypothetical protein